MDIEKIATSAVETSISKTDRLSPFINSGDKEPAWDGNIYIHKDKKKTKEGIKKVAAQVKGKVVGGKFKNTISYPVDIVDLEDYMNNGGAMFFVVYIDKQTGDALQIYYSALTPFRISEMLKGKSNKRKLSVPFEKFPDNNVEKTVILEGFHTNSTMQVSFAGKEPPTITDLAKQGILESLTIRYGGLRKGKKDDFFPRIVDGGEMYVYANVKGGSAPTPVEYYNKVSQITMSTDRDIPVYVGGTKFYDKMVLVSTSDKRTFKIGKSMTLSFPIDDEPEKPKPTTIKIKLQGTLQERIQDLKFLISLFEQKKFKMGDLELPADFPEKDLAKLKIETYPDILEGYVKLHSALTKLSVKKELDLDKCTDADINKINMLVAAVEDDEPIYGLAEDLPILVNLNICNLHLVMLCRPNDDGSRSLQDYFTTSVPVVVMDKENNPYPTSQFAIMKAESFNTIDNINYESIVKDFERLEIQDFLLDTANQLLLEMVKAYDQKASKELYQAMMSLVGWMKKHPQHITAEVVQLNELQIIARARSLQHQEKRVLYEIVSNTDEVFFKIGAFLLLDEQKEAQNLLDLLSSDQKEEFINLPIYKFFKNPKEEQKNG